MITLALESAAAVASVALTCRTGARWPELTLDNGNTHSETLLPMVGYRCCPPDRAERLRT